MQQVPRLRSCKRSKSSGEDDEVDLADTLVAIAYAKVRMSEIDVAIPLMEKALRTQSPHRMSRLNGLHLCERACDNCQAAANVVRIMDWRSS
jgi:hypothetical protein